MNYADNKRKKKCKDQLTRGVLEQRIAGLDKYWEKFRTLHWKLIAVPEDQLGDYLTAEIYETTEDTYFQTSGALHDLLRTVTPAQAAPAIEQNDESTRAPAVKLTDLARINLPTFDGDWLNWPNFKSMFESLVHEDDTIPRQVKLQHLKTHLTGPAAADVENVHVSDEGYEGNGPIC